MLQGHKNSGTSFFTPLARTIQVAQCLPLSSVISIDLSPAGSILATGSGDWQARICTYHLNCHCTISKPSSYTMCCSSGSYSAQWFTHFLYDSCFPISCLVPLRTLSYIVRCSILRLVFRMYRLRPARLKVVYCLCFIYIYIPFYTFRFLHIVWYAFVWYDFYLALWRMRFE